MVLNIIYFLDSQSCDCPFTISPKWFFIDSGETKTLKCSFQPQKFSNIYFAELEATIHFGQSSSDFDEAIDVLPSYVAPISISIAVTGMTYIFIYYNITLIYRFFEFSFVILICKTK